MHRHIFAATATAILAASGWHGAALAQTDPVEEGHEREEQLEQTGQENQNNADMPGEPAAEYTLPEGGVVEVDVDLDALGTAAAGTRWNDISDDLENALAARLVNSAFLSANPQTSVIIDINEVSIAGSLEAAAGVAETALEGTVNVTHPSDNTVFDTYDLSVSFADAGPSYIPEGTDMATVTATSDAYYDAMINAFADRVAERLEGS